MVEWSFLFLIIGGAIGWYRASKNNGDKAKGALIGGIIGAFVGFLIPFIFIYLLFGVLQMP